MKFNVIGFSKCGTQSLEKHLVNLGHDVIRTELVYIKNGIELHKKHYSEYQPVLITRNPEERMKSLYHYNHYFEDMDYETFKITNHQRGINFGVQTPLSCSKYENFIKEWQEFEPLVFSLEELKKLDSFPHLNKNFNYDKMQVIT